MQYQDVIRFWFEECQPESWFKKDSSFDQEITDRFFSVHFAATQGQLDDWREFPEGRLAEIIVLDQFSRNMYRDEPKAFAYDNLALILAQEAVRAQADTELSSNKKAFLYMPFMHSESLLIHHKAVRLFSQPGLEENLKFELLHKSIIEKFGRYPHRNQVLGRPSTAAEIEFLKQPNSSF